MDLPIRSSLDEILLHIQSDPPGKLLFWGEGVGTISSYVAGWMASEGIRVVVLDGANQFNPYTVSSFARKVSIPPERLLKRIQIARAFTCYQMATMIGEKLDSLLSQEGIAAQPQKPWVILLGPITTFLDEDVPEREVRPLFERSLRKISEMSMRGVPFFLFQPYVFSENRSIEKTHRTPPFTRRGMGELVDSRRTYLLRCLFQSSDLVWKIHVDDEGPKLILEKTLTLNHGIGDLRLGINQSLHVISSH